MSDDADFLYLAREIARLRRQVRNLGRSSQAAYRSVELADGSVDFYNEDGSVAARIGAEAPDLAVVTEELPYVPTEPTVTPVEGGLAVDYDGTFEDGNWDETISHVEVHSLLEADDETGDDTQFYTFTSSNGGTAFLPVDISEGERFIVLQAVGKNGIEGVVSAAGSGTALPGVATFTTYDPVSGKVSLNVGGTIRTEENAHSQRDISGPVSIPDAAWTTVNFNSIAQDNPPPFPPPGRPTLITEQGIDYAGGIWTIEQHMKYIITATAVFDANATGRRGVRIVQNGVEITAMETGAVGGSQSVNVAITRDLAEADEIEVQVYQNSGGALDLQAKSIVTMTGIG